jgi:hypothetical protein
MRLEVVVTFIVDIPEESGAEGVDPSGVYTKVKEVEFIDGAGDDRSVIADSSNIIEHTTTSVTVMTE